MANANILSIGVIGIRDYKNAVYDNTDYVSAVMAELFSNYSEKHPEKELRVVTGGGQGVERLVINWCEANGIKFRTIPPNIKQYGATKAFTVRSNTIALQSDELLLFWDGTSVLQINALTTASSLKKRSILIPVI